MAAFINLAGYKFVPLGDLVALRRRLLSSAQARQLKGTILLSPEGINLFIAGTRSEVDAFVDSLRTIPGLEDIAMKESVSASQPFGRMRVKLKREIIPFGVAGIDPARRPSAKVSAQTLRQWLDEGRPVTLLDTRNNYEVNIGTFRGALPAGI